MAATTQQIRQAYKALGWEATESEIQDIQRNPDFWGSNTNTVADKLLNSARFHQQPKTEDNIKVAWKALYGVEPNPQQLNEVMRNTDFWGTNMGSHIQGIKQTGQYQANPGIKVEERARDEALTNNIKNGLGLDDEDIAKLDRNQMDFFGQIGAQMIDNIEKSIPAPTTFTAETFEELYTQARNNPKINQYYADVENRAVEDILNTVAQTQEDFNYIQTRQARQFTDQVEQLQGEVEQAGLLYSGKRREAEEKLREEQMGVVRSTISEAKRNLQEVGRKAEEQLGSEKVKQLNLQLAQNATYGQFVNPQVQAMMNKDNLQYQGYGTGITETDSGIGRAKQQEVTEEYQRLQNERLLLTNPNQMT